MKLRLLLLLLTFSFQTKAQTLPDEMRITPDGRMLMIGDQANTGFYNQLIVNRIDLTFPSANYWTQLTSNYATKTYIPATLLVDGLSYDSVGVRLRGNTSYQQGGTYKKSFKIELDNWKSGQDHQGYSTIKLNNMAQDPSMMREVFFETQIKRHIPCAKTSFVKLYLNNSNWGLYNNVQQLNKDFLEEWYISNDGTWWRADKPVATGGPGGGASWGDGTAALNYISTDTTLYKTYYTLKNTTKLQPWDDLLTICNKLNTIPIAQLADSIENYLDLDRTLWYLASEIAWTDDDSYVFKGKMDYYVHYELESGRITPHEFDGNSSIATSRATTWSVFYNANNANYPLLNRLLANTDIRQRYLAHMRTIIAEEFDTAQTNATLNAYKALVDTVVLNDTKKAFTYNQFNTEINVLKSFVNTRKNFLNANTEIQQVAPVITDAPYYVSGVQYQQPAAGQVVTIRTTVTSTAGIDNVKLFFSPGIVGRFFKTDMFDDGAHDDLAAGDGIFGGSIPGYAAGTFLRYYIQAASANTAKSVSYFPAGAEHNVFIYTVAPNSSSGGTTVVINELMAQNLSAVADNAGEFDDWIELYNTGNAPVDLSGFYLTDNTLNLDKWDIPAGTIIQPGDYLIVWADEDSSQGPYHANFKLSGTGEALYLLDTAQTLVDSVSWGQQTVDLAYARRPNGIGSFAIQGQTFAANNDNVNIAEIEIPATLSLYPNPATATVTIQSKDVRERPIFIRNMIGQLIQELPYADFTTADVSTMSDGMYLVQCGNAVKKMVVKH
jgi:spore coat protein CotH